MSFSSTLSNNRFWKKNGAPLTWAIALLCLVLAIFFIGWTLYSHAQIKNANYQPQNVSPLNKSVVESYRVTDIVSANLFGDPTPKVVVENAPETTLDLSLQGILWASDHKLARAIIVAGNKKPGLYSVGEEIKDSGASIQEIRSNEVLLDRNGATESLPMVKLGSDADGPLIVFSDPNANTQAEPEFYNEPSSTTPTKPSLSNARSSVPKNSLKQNARPFKEPEGLSSLDRALQKMGEM